MTQGVLLFASNNKEIDYTTLAEQCAIRCKQYLNVPVSLVTTTPLEIKHPEIFDSLIVISEDTEVQYRNFKNSDATSSIGVWKNFSRADAWALTPYDETLVIDVDYFLYTDTLKWCFDQPGDLVIGRHSLDLSFARPSTEFEYLGNTLIDFYWATVFFFRKTDETKTFFELISHIKDNWIFYKQQYQFSSRLYRNDFSFSIAANILSGIVTDLPFKLHFVTDQDVVLSVDDVCCKVLTRQSPGRYIVADIRGVDLHIMNKLALQELSNE